MLQIFVRNLIEMNVVTIENLKEDFRTVATKIIPQICFYYNITATSTAYKIRN